MSFGRSEGSLGYFGGGSILDMQGAGKKGARTSRELIQQIGSEEFDTYRRSGINPKKIEEFVSMGMIKILDNK